MVGWSRSWCLPRWRPSCRIFTSAACREHSLGSAEAPVSCRHRRVTFEIQRLFARYCTRGVAPCPSVPGSWCRRSRPSSRRRSARGALIVAAARWALSTPPAPPPPRFLRASYHFSPALRPMGTMEIFRSFFKFPCAPALWVWLAVGNYYTVFYDPLRVPSAAACFFWADSRSDCIYLGLACSSAATKSRKSRIATGARLVQCRCGYEGS